MRIEGLDSELEKSLNKLLVEVSKKKEVYGNSSKIQMWVALAILNSRIEEIIKMKSSNVKLKKSLKKL